MSARLNSYPCPAPAAIVQLRKKPLARWTVHTATSMFDGQQCRRHERERARHEQQAAGELDESDEDGQGEGGLESELREERGRPRQAAAAPQAEQLLRSMRRENRPDCQPEHGRTEECHDVIVSPFMPGRNTVSSAHDNDEAVRC